VTGRWRLLAIALSVAGIGVSIYLTVLHYLGFAPACPTTGPVNCETVLTSKYAVLAGTSIPTSALGIVWFTTSAVFWIGRWRRLINWWSGTGLAFALVLVFVEVGLLGAICLWCTAAHLLVLTLFLMALTVWQQERK
jgi:uncharacterized membrane protein